MIRCATALALVLVLSGCDATDPYRRSDVWYPTGANAGNIAAMAANPGDLVIGRGARGPEPRGGVAAVEKYWQGDTRTALPAPGAPAGAISLGRGLPN